jgi:glycosyltransferase involved in cell wall biosynthesis
VDKLKWPFLLVLDSRQNQTGWALLNGPIVTHAQQEQFAELRRRDCRFVGMSSYADFPLTEGADGLEYEGVCEAWCHCFRKPDLFFTTSIPRDLISMSDFTDYYRVSPQYFMKKDSVEKFDVVYVGIPELWKDDAKKWSLAGRCLPRICAELGLRALVIGTPDDSFAAAPQVTFTSQLPWNQFLSHLAQARFLFVPNVMDPSPKLLGEALCLDVPLVVNRKILGGWKYINAFTGVFFDDEENVVNAVKTCLERSLRPRDWFRANYGPYRAGKRLLKLLRSVDPAIGEESHLCFGEGEEETARPARC